MAAKTLEVLIAEAEIRDVHLSFCRAVDWADLDLLRLCFHPDQRSISGSSRATLILSSNSPPGAFRPTPGSQEPARGSERNARRAEHYTHATHRIAADENGSLRDYMTSMPHINTMEQREGQWGIARRALARDWAGTDPVPDAGPGPQTRGASGTVRTSRTPLHREVFERGS